MRRSEGKKVRRREGEGQEGQEDQRVRRMDDWMNYLAGMDDLDDSLREGWGKGQKVRRSEGEKERR